MAPKKRPTTSSTSRQIDDFIGQSEVEPGQEAALISSKLQKEKVAQLQEKFYDAKAPTILMLNMRCLSEVRTLGTIFIGIASGILGLDGL